ncbi:MAG: ABC transporter permease [Zoogloeaceae bacterium]|jgi:ABC-2 type transport system permease protein|nr:ABC transporter permease [Zoogloeaceae bacterium]
MPLLFRLAALWKKEALALTRDRHALAALFIMPAIFILVMSLALADTDAFSGKSRIAVRYALLDLDDSRASRELDARLDAIEAFEKHAPPADADAARRQVESGEIAFALVIPQGYGQQIDAQKTPALQLLIDPALPRALREGFYRQVEAASIRVSVLFAIEALEDSLLSDAPQLTALEAPRLAVEAVGHGDDPAPVLPSAVQQNVPAWLIFSMFFVVIPISAVFIGERQHGTLQRLATQRVSFGLVLAGKFLPFVLLNQIQAVVMVGVGRWLAPLCGSEALALPEGAAALAALWLVSLAVSAAAVGWALLIASLAKSSEQATVLGGVGNILMGAVGGVMAPRFLMPAAMQPWTRLSPMDWALEGFHQVMLRGGGIPDVLPAAAALVAFGLAALGLAWQRSTARTP